VRDGSFQVIEKGLSPGERVVVEGIQKVRAGSVVAPKAAAAPGPAATGR
jgi:multidrug efflux pump subunit AcrA (membrane-fusion protein)